MMLTPWRPFSWLPAMPRLGNGFPTFSLPLEVKRTDEGYQIQAPLAGFKPEDVEVTFTEGNLTISAKHSEEKKTEEEGKFLHREFSYGSFTRQVRLPADVKPEDITAGFENGMLTIDVKHAEAQPVKIAVGATKQPEPATQS